MKLAFLVERPTQFEAPFYRFAAADPAHELRVLFTAVDAAGAVFDPELGRPVEWGIDLLGGYPHEVVPAAGRTRFFADRLAGRDLVIVNGWTRRVYLDAARAARRVGAATALRLDTVPFGTPAAKRAVRRAVYRAALPRLFDLFLGVGSWSLDELAACGVPQDCRGLFPYAIDVETFRARSAISAHERHAVRVRLGVPAGARAVLALAKFGPREAPWDLLGAAASLPEDVWLVLAGDGPERPALQAAARDRGLARLAFPGYVPYPELPALYAACDLFVHPAREERWGVSVEEALACGLAVVASARVGAARDLIAAGGNGFTYQPGDATGLARRIAEALALPPERVRAASAEVLARWDYAAAWHGLVEAAARTIARTTALRNGRAGGRA